MNTNILFFVVFIVLASCESYYVPDIAEQKECYVFEGLITDNPGEGYVKISLTQSYNSGKLKQNSVSNFQVLIESNDSETFYLNEIEPGCYKVKENEVGIHGKMYRLKAISPSGTVYLSEFEKLIPYDGKPTVGGEYESKIIEDFIPPNEYVERKVRQVKIVSSINTDGSTPFFRFEYELLLQQVQDLFLAETFYFFRKCSSFNENYVSVVNANLYDKSNVINFPTALISHDFLVRPYDLNIYYTEEMQLKVESYGFFVRQYAYSLSESGYSFWQSIAKQKLDNSYFDAVENQIVGNVASVQQPDELVFGYFGASAVKCGLKYLYLKLNNEIVEKDIEEWPITDTIRTSFVPFDFWVWPY